MSGGGPDLLALLPLLRFLSSLVVFPRGGIFDRDDLVQDAYLALMVALPRFDPERGTFERFAMHHGLSAMRDAVRRAEHSRSRTRRGEMPPDARAEEHATAFALSDVTRGLCARSLVILEHWTLGRTVADVASELHMSREAVFRAMRPLKELLRARVSAAVA